MVRVALDVAMVRDNPRARERQAHHNPQDPHHDQMPQVDKRDGEGRNEQKSEPRYTVYKPLSTDPAPTTCENK